MMWFDGIRQPNTLYVASVSRGKDSTAMLRAIQLMGWPLDAICSVDIWFDENTPAELPPMVAFKNEWDRKCLEWFGIPVTRLCATKRERERETESDGECHSPESCTSYFYRRRDDGQFVGAFVGFPMQRGSWCKKLKYEQVDLYGHLLSQSISAERERERVAKRQKQQRKLPNLGLPANQRRLVSVRPQTISTYGFPNNQCRWCTGELKNAASRAFRGGRERGVRTDSKGTTSTEFSDERPDKAQKINIVHYVGIAADEPIRIARHLPKPDKVLPLVQIGWDEDLCGLEATYMDMLSPTYEGSCRDGCWFCHNQGIGQLRNLRKNYPELWEKLLKLDLDSPVTFHADGHTVHDFDKRFQWEDDGFIQQGKQFRWSDIEEPQMNFWQLE